ncbi:MAG TPA: class I SAM-dependent methyltransferase [Candidatus Limnocylindrales bacterium]|nr:class I SAM-dependent methyltransferase [Candidatus Limnocylindrales bacterium]
MPPPANDPTPAAIARLYDLDLSEFDGDIDLYLALAQRTGGPILELAVGTGRIAAPLAEAGYRVVGLDLDPAMLARARSRIDRAGLTDRIDLVEGDMTAAAAIPAVVRGGPYRLAILALQSILILTTPDGQRSVVEQMARLVAPGGLVVVDTWLPTPADLVGFDGRLSFEWLRTDPDTGHQVTKTMAAWYDHVRRLVTLTTFFDEGDPGAAPVRWLREDPLRLIGVDELVGFARDAGLDIDRLAGDHDLEPLEPGSDRVVLVARKPG